MSFEQGTDVLNQTSSASDDYAIRVDAVSKVYGLWSSPNARLHHVLMDMIKGIVPAESRITQRMNAKIASIYREFNALETISFDIRKGESWGFIGVNGSGKSTLLKMISGNLRPSSGRIEVDGKVAILDYSSGLHGDFTGRENIFLKASVLGMTRAETEAKLQSIIDFAEIGSFIDQPVKTYSSGMTARLGFAIVAHTDADIIITDEALAVGDAFFVQKCMDHIRSFLKRGTFLFVSHSTNDVVSLCQKAVWLEHGKVRKIGLAKDVAEAYLTSHSIRHSELYLQNALAAVSASEDGTKSVRPDLGVGSSASEIDGEAIARQTDAKPARRIRDMRADFINGSTLRNDVEVVRAFEAEDGDAKGGVGGARVLDVAIEDASQNILSYFVGGEMARIRIIVEAQRAIKRPIVGFQVKDRLGQILFADNTSVATGNIDKPFQAAAGQNFEALFEFQMPLLPVGEYAVSVVVADGHESANATLDRVRTALTLRSVTSGLRHGLVGVPMHYIRLGPAEVQPQTSVLEVSANLRSAMRSS